MSDVSQETVSPGPELTTTEPKATEQKQSDSVSFLNEETKTEAKTPSTTETTKPAGAPEKYTDFTFPEGFEANPTMMGEAQTLFKDLNLNQAQAQRAVDLYSKASQDASNALVEHWVKTQQDWKDQLKADPEIGGKLQDVRQTVGRAIDALGNAALGTEFRKIMDDTGVGSHPAFVKVFYKLAQQLTEGSHVAGGGPSKTKPASGAQAMYPNLPSTG